MEGSSRPWPWYQNFLAALEFLTILPVNSRQVFDPRAMVPYFALAGLVIGSLVSLLDTGLHFVLPAAVAAALDLVMLAVITGGLHLDGLADTCDGLYGKRSRRQALDIMKDSRLGAMGAIALGLCLITKWIALANMVENRQLWLLLAPAYARGAVLFALAGLPYCRQEGGTAGAFCRQPPSACHHLALAAVAAVSCLAGIQAIVINLAYLVLVTGTLAYYRRKLGCITGDMLGAMIEVVETGLLLAACIRIVP